MKRMTYRLEDQYGNPTDSIILESDLIFLNSSEKWKKVLSRLAAYEETGLEPEEIKEQIGFLSPICIGCPGKKDGIRTEICGYDTGDMTRCLEQVRWLKRLAEAALRREQDGE